MGENTSNQNRAIATLGTPHIAMTQGDTDAHMDPDNRADTQLFANEAPMALLTPGTSATLIGGQPVWTAAHQVGPTSSPEHPPYTLGVVSGTYLQEARATSYSADVILEGGGVVRSFDATTQNHGNTTGIVEGGMIDVATTPDEAFLLQMCAMASVSGINVGPVAPPEGVTTGVATAARPLGYPGPATPSVPAFYLEILSGTEVTFTAQRQDLTASGVNPTCYRGIHTRWVTVIPGPGDGQTQVIPVEGTDSYVLDGALTRLRIGNDGGPFQLDLSSDAADVSVAGMGAEIGVEGLLQSIEAVFAIFRYRNSPLGIAVQAWACASCHVSAIVVYPSQQVDLTITLEEDNGGDGPGARALRNVKETLRVLNDVGDVVQKIAVLAQREVSFQFCEAAELNFQLGYLCCSEEKTGAFGRHYTPAHVGLPWALAFTASPLIGFEVEFNVSILNLVVPCLGEVVASALRWIGVAADVVFSASLQVPLSVSVGRDEYDFPASTGVTIGIGPVFSLGFDVATFVQWVSFRTEFTATLNAAFTLGDSADVLLQLQPTGDLTTVMTVVLLEDTWFEATYSGEVEFLRVHWDGPKLDVLTKG